MIKCLGSKRPLLPCISSIATNRFKRSHTICNHEPSEWGEMFWPLRPFGAERPGAVWGVCLSYADDGEMREEFVGSGFFHVGDEDLGGFGADSAQGG
jgi:hypothetical protein